MNKSFFYLLEYKDNYYLIICAMLNGKIILPMVALKLNLSILIDGLESLV